MGIPDTALADEICIKWQNNFASSIGATAPQTCAITWQEFTASLMVTFKKVGEGKCMPALPQLSKSETSEEECQSFCKDQFACVGFDTTGNSCTAYFKTYADTDVTDALKLGTRSGGDLGEADISFTDGTT